MHPAGAMQHAGRRHRADDQAAGNAEAVGEPSGDRADATTSTASSTIDCGSGSVAAARRRQAGDAEGRERDRQRDRQNEQPHGLHHRDRRARSRR